MVIRAFEIELRSRIENECKIRWATFRDKKMRQTYSQPINIFGENLSDSRKIGLLRTMIRNSGFSEDYLGIRDKSGISIYGDIDKFQSVVCIYPNQTERGSYMHEGIHFLGNYGFKNKRLIYSDIPLANVVGDFFYLTDNQSLFKEFVKNGYPKKLNPRDETKPFNPFLYKFEEHSDEEVAEACKLSLTAYLISRRDGERAGIDFIKKLYEEGRR